MDSVTCQILAKVGRPVNFRYPGDEGHKKGVLRDRHVLPPQGGTGVPYWDVVDLICFPDEAETEWIRIGYYRKAKDRLVWGSQTTITEPVATWKRLLVGAARSKPWLRKLVEDVMAELNQPEARETKPNS